MLGVFAINLYIGLYDTNLTQISPVHTELNWIIAAADLLAALFLLVKPKNVALKVLGGIIWPITYIASLFVDVETKMCLGAAANTCLPNVSSAYQYLILGSASQDWVLWPYTIRLAISLAVIVFVLSVFSLYFRASKKDNEKTTPNPTKGTPPQHDNQSAPTN